jgi:competence protein CoiA
MKFALVNHEKSTSELNLQGVCIHCAQAVVSKCNQSNMWHWSHEPNKGCDTWFENETEWHRDWKSQYLEENQEVLHQNSDTGKKHIADAKTPQGLVLKFQDSPLSVKEIEAREKFYGNMIWVVNGQHFKSNFFIMEKLPDTNSLLGCEIAQVEPPMIKKQGFVSYGTYAKISDFKFEQCEGYSVESYPSISAFSRDYKLKHNIKTLEEEIAEQYVGHHAFIWREKNKKWLEATKPVFLDFNDGKLWLLMKHSCKSTPSYKGEFNNSIWCVIAFAKEDFLKWTYRINQFGLASLPKAILQ